MQRGREYRGAETLIRVNVTCWPLIQLANKLGIAMELILLASI